MSLKDKIFKYEYRSLQDNITNEFYVPALSEAINYKRAVGFFSSAVLIQIADGLKKLVLNDGVVKLIVSPYLNEDDVKAIEEGYKEREEIIKEALNRQLYSPKDMFEKRKLNFLANLIATNVLDIKVALTNRDKKIGMYHEKMGIITDCDGNKIAFSGSMNESLTALNDNYETIDVYCSWKSEESNERIRTKEKAFDSIWNNTELGIKTESFPMLKEDIIKKYKTNDDVYLENNNDNEQTVDEVVEEYFENDWFPKMPRNIKFYDYQNDAIDEWERQNYRGIFDMATGTGKTFTGLGAMTKLSNRLKNHLTVIIVCPFKHLVQQWVEDLENFNIKPIIAHSESPQKNWKRVVKDKAFNQELNIPGEEFICLITTNVTFSSKLVQDLIKYDIQEDILLIVDEAHNMGATRMSEALNEKIKYRLALSATINRHNDEDGTNRLLKYFGKRCITYTLEKAIKENKLTRYKYYPIITTLNDMELKEYTKLSIELAKCFIKMSNGNYKLSEWGKKVARKRSGIVSGAEDKLFKLKENIEKYKKDTHMLVYCGATKIKSEFLEKIVIDEKEIRQIDLVTKILGNEEKMKVAQFTAKENNSERKRIKEAFSNGENLQALVAIKCLDEGVNIPKIKTAFILASTTNPKEYIQRRGRLLRKSAGKEVAEIYDFITLPRDLSDVYSLTEGEKNSHMGLVKNELKRLEEFSRLAINTFECQETIDYIKESYNIENEEEYQVEDYYGEDDD